jgi:hypothetical protein
MVTSIVHTAVIATPYSNEPLLLYVRSCLNLVGCVYKHLYPYMIQWELQYLNNFNVYNGSEGE